MKKQGCCLDKACTRDTCMNLPEGKMCGDCIHIARCKAIYGHTEIDTYCDWFPRRFTESKEIIREWILDRYHDGVKMAEGARVNASTLEEAIEKAKNLPGIPSFKNDTFKEKPRHD